MERLEILQAIHRRLNFIMTLGPIDPKGDVCSNCEKYWGPDDTPSSALAIYMEVRYATRSWPHFSGDLAHPVPATHNSDMPGSAKKAAIRSKNLWARDSAYGQSRWHLVRWLREYFERAIAKEYHAQVVKFEVEAGLRPPSKSHEAKSRKDREYLYSLRKRFPKMEGPR